MPLAEFARLGFGHIRRADRQLTAVGHGVARIHGEIDDNLFELMQVRLDRPEIARRFETELDVLAKKPVEQDGQVGQDISELQDLWTQGLLTREREQLPDKPGGAVGVLFDVHDVLERRVGRTVIE